MQYSKLGHSNLSVSRVCLGTMTWGTQNNQQDANEQMAHALGCGVNFVDTAEMYSIPPTPESYGATETIIGHWNAANPSRREDYILATKMVGVGLKWIRGGSEISADTVMQAIDASLARLQTDYIDLYQLHWPNRTTPHFGKHAPGAISFSDVDTAAHSEQMLGILQVLDEAVKCGKIRHFGLSDDSPWGVSEYIRLSEKHNMTRVTSIQNEFNLLHAKDWPYAIEQCVHTDVAYLPWSPLASGVLSGKYLNGARPEGSRWSLSARNGFFRDTAPVHEATQAYVDLAKKHGVTPAQLALGWIDQLDGVTSTIIGATSMEQLKDDLSVFEKPLSKELLEEVAEVWKCYPMPF